MRPEKVVAAYLGNRYTRNSSEIIVVLSEIILKALSEGKQVNSVNHGKRKRREVIAVRTIELKEKILQSVGNVIILELPLLQAKI